MTEINATAQRRYDATKIEDQLAEKAVQAAIYVHQTLGGPGLLESLYEEALAYELRLRSIPTESQIQIPVTYRGHQLRSSMRLDLLVGQKLIIEVKATDKQLDIYKAQVLTYLRLTGLKLGLVVNFGHSRLLEGVSRVVNGL